MQIALLQTDNNEHTHTVTPAPTLAPIRSLTHTHIQGGTHTGTREMSDN